MPAIQFPTGFFLSKLTASPLEGGKLYIGQPNLDPTVLGNRVSVTIIQQNGTPIVIATNQQPFILNSAGMIVYGGSVVQARVDTNVSMAIHDENDVPQYYFPSAAASSDVVASLIQLAVTGSPPTPAAGAGWIYTGSIAGIAELFYMDSEGNQVQITSGGALFVELPDSVVEVLRLIASEEVKGLYFGGTPVELEIDEDDNVTVDWSLGTTFSLTMDQNVNAIKFIGMDAAVAQSIAVRIENTGSFTVTTFEPNVMGWSVWKPSGADLQPVASTVTSYGCVVFADMEMHVFPREMEEHV